MGNEIIASGNTFDIGCQVVRWDEPGGFSFYAKQPKYNAHPHDDFEAIKKRIKQVVYHHSATYTAKHTYNGLIARGLSCNFIIDDNDVGGYATIFQCLDIRDSGWSQAPLNNSGVGVEVSYHPAYFSNKDFYSEKNCQRYNVPEHEVVEDVLHGQKLKVFAPTEAQIASCIALGNGLCQLLDIPAEFPKAEDNSILKTAMKNPADHNGLINHFQITRNKIDPAGFPSDRVETEIKHRIWY